MSNPKQEIQRLRIAQFITLVLLAVVALSASYLESKSPRYPQARQAHTKP